MVGHFCPTAGAVPPSASRHRRACLFPHGSGVPVLTALGVRGAYHETTMPRVRAARPGRGRGAPMPDTMRGVYTNLTKIRRQVFREVARAAYLA